MATKRKRRCIARFSIYKKTDILSAKFNELLDKLDEFTIR